ncbi:hypothetical protein QBC45DRAFT_406793 [Copromyces sp. CBS 386.78]|nr:hypothetical protein QBC45DRAFT_406793 [Copromyces sp. CBS 386.78]
MGPSGSKARAGEPGKILLAPGPARQLPHVPARCFSEIMDAGKRRASKEAATTTERCGGVAVCRMVWMRWGELE